MVVLRNQTKIVGVFGAKSEIVRFEKLESLETHGVGS